MKKLFVVSELFYPNKTSTAYIMTELAKYLASSYTISVLTTDIKYDENLSDELEKLNFSITRKKVGSVDKNSFFSRVKGALGSSYVLSKELFKNIKKGDKALVVTNPFLIILFVAIIRVFKKFEFTLLVHDVFPENTIPGGLKKESSLSYKILKRIFDWSYRQADKIVVLGGDMKKLIEKKGVSSKKIEVISNWYDEDVISCSLDREKYLGVTNLQDKLVIGFAGNVGRVQGLDKFIECFKKANNNKLVFVVIGEGAQLEELKVNSKECENIYFLGSKPRNEQSKFLNSFDIALITLAEGMYGLGVPSKSYNILKVGKPILYIGDDSSEIDMMISTNNCGWSFSWSESEKLVELLNSLKDLEKTNFRENNISLAETKFSLPIVIEKFKAVLDA